MCCLTAIVTGVAQLNGVVYIACIKPPVIRRFNATAHERLGDIDIKNVKQQTDIVVCEKTSRVVLFRRWLVRMATVARWHWLRALRPFPILAVFAVGEIGSTTCIVPLQTGADWRRREDTKTRQALSLHDDASSCSGVTNGNFRRQSICPYQRGRHWRNSQDNCLSWARIVWMWRRAGVILPAKNASRYMMYYVVRRTPPLNCLLHFGEFEQLYCYNCTTVVALIRRQPRISAKQNGVVGMDVDLWVEG